MNDMVKTGKASQAKIESNRKNSLRSTGPKSKKGKSVVKWNALKHGLLSKEIVISTGEGQECIHEYGQLLEQLHTELKPVGIIEEMLVEKIAVCYWRQRRVIKCEIGEIRKQLDSATWKLMFKRVDEYNFDKRYIMIDSNREKLSRTSFGLRYLIGTLEDIKVEIESDGGLSEQTKEKLIGHFGLEQGHIGFLLTLFDHMSTDGRRLSEEDPEKYGEPLEPDRAKELMLKAIDDEIKKMQDIKESFNEIEDMESDANSLSLHLPDKIVLDKTLRYETTMERQFYRALHELIRLQSARLGGNPPAPQVVDVDISKEL